MTFGEEINNPCGRGVGERGVRWGGGGGEQGLEAGDLKGFGRECGLSDNVGGELFNSGSFG